MITRPAWAVALLLLPTSLAAQTTPSRIGGAQASNTRVTDSSATTTTTSDASGTARIIIKPHAAARAATTRTGAKPPASHMLPMNDTLPTDPMVAVELYPEAFQPFVVHREPCVIAYPRDAIHTRGPVVVDVSLDLNGVVDKLDYIGPPDLGAACMEALRGWKFAPYQFHGKPWRVTSWVRFEFATAYQKTAVPKLD